MSRLRSLPWIWSAIGCALLWAYIALETPVRTGASLFTSIAAVTCILALIGIGQMFPIATGGGGIDLSIPFVMTAAAFLAVQQVDSSGTSIAIAVLQGIGFGVLVGAVNGLVTVTLRIPPIIGTLAVGFIVLSYVQVLANRGLTRFVDDTFTEWARGDLVGVPHLTLVVAAIGLAAGLLLHRMRIGRGLLAVGQSPLAAVLAGIHVKRTVMLAYMFCGACAGLGGVLFAAQIGSADQRLGTPYLLASVGAVILGGNLVSGGTGSVVGTVLGALLLTLLERAVTVSGWDLSFRSIATGAVITLVLVAASGGEGRGRMRTWLASLWPSPPTLEERA